MIGIHETCLHVSRQIDAGSLGPHRRVQHLLLCDACLDPRLVPFEGSDSRGFFWGGSDPLSEAARQAYDDLNPNLDVRCVECTASAQVHYARAAGQPPPWPAYERTLTGNEVDRPHVVRLRRLVESSREWRSSIVRPKHLAVFVSGGAFTYPLTVTAYYVVDPGEQRALVELVQSFLSDYVKNQALVRFIEAENWQRKRSGAAFRGPERVLAEHYLNSD